MDTPQREYRTARRKRRPNVGLALGGGLPFGAAAIGVLDVFERHRIPIDCLAGTSMGSVVGLLYAYGYSPGELEDRFTQYFERRRLIPALLRDLRISRTGFVRGNQVVRALAELVPERTTFEDLRLPFAVPAVDLDTGQEIVFRAGRVLPAVRASISMPGIFHPVAWGETYLVDGALISPIPVHLLGALGADLEIPMRAIRHRPVEERQRFADIRDVRARARPKHHPPDLLRLVWRSLSLILQDQFAEMLMDQYPLAIKPELPFDYAGDPQKVDAIIQLGRDAAMQKVEAIKAALAAPISRAG